MKKQLLFCVGLLSILGANESAFAKCSMKVEVRQGEFKMERINGNSKGVWNLALPCFITCEGSKETEAVAIVSARTVSGSSYPAATITMTYAEEHNVEDKKELFKSYYPKNPAYKFDNEKHTVVTFQAREDGSQIELKVLPRFDSTSIQFMILSLDLFPKKQLSRL